MAETFTDADRELIRVESRRLLREAIEQARRAGDPVLAELGRELAAGTVTPYQAAGAYRDLLEERWSTAVAYHFAGEEEQRALAAGDAAPAVRVERDDEDFAETTFMIPATEPTR